MVLFTVTELSRDLKVVKEHSVWEQIGTLSGTAQKTFDFSQYEEICLVTTCSGNAKLFYTVKIPVIGMGGISSAHDVIEMMVAGASAVAIGCQNLVDPYACYKIIQDLPKELEKLGVQDINEIVRLSHQD